MVVLKTLLLFTSPTLIYSSVSSQLSLLQEIFVTHIRLRLLFCLPALIASGSYPYHKTLSKLNHNICEAAPLDVSVLKTGAVSPPWSRMKLDRSPALLPSAPAELTGPHLLPSHRNVSVLLLFPRVLLRPSF